MLGLFGMKVQLTSQDLPENDPEIQIHGKRPSPHQRSCRNCGLQNSCVILMMSMASMTAIMPMPSKNPTPYKDKDGRWVEQQDMPLPLPMPCRGDVWQPKQHVGFENNPLINRLGLNNVSEPTPFYPRIKENEKE